MNDREEHLHITIIRDENDPEMIFRRTIIGMRIHGEEIARARPGDLSSIVWLIEPSERARETVERATMELKV